MTKRKRSTQCLLFMSTSEASLGDGAPKVHTSKRDAIEEAIEWIGRSPHYRAYIDCANHQQFTYEDLVRIRLERELVHSQFG
jgi:hypothetical protein